MGPYSLLQKLCINEGESLQAFKQGEWDHGMPKGFLNFFHVDPNHNQFLEIWSHQEALEDHGGIVLDAQCCEAIQCDALSIYGIELEV